MTILFLMALGTKCSGQCAKIDIIVLVDMSHSVKGHDGYIRNAVHSFADDLDLDEEGVRLGVITFNSYANIIHPLDANKEKLLQDIRYINDAMVYGTTLMDYAIKKATMEYEERGRVESGKILIIISDGNPNYEDAVIGEMTEIRNIYNPTVFGIMIKSDEENEIFMKSIVDVYIETNFEMLVNEIKRLNLCL